jgi:pimeloyl-ACP methyl ester carboxylesterase
LGFIVIICIIISALLLILAVLIFVPPKVTVSGIPGGFSEKRFDTGKVVLNYVEGPENGMPLLLIPGQMESWQGYKLVMPKLAKRFHVFSVDLRGHGKSSRTPGEYSYNICGNDLKLFLENVIREPAVVSGLSSGAVLAVWLAANAPDSVRAAVAEDPPMFSSIWPRIRDEKYMTYLFQNAVDTLGGDGGRDLEAYYMRSGIPKAGSDRLYFIPPPIAKGIVGIFNLNRRYRPERIYDPPLLPFSIRASFKFLLEYDVDFSLATIDGRLSQGFDPEDALVKVKCPMLLLHASWSRHETWGLLGAMDDADAQRMISLVENMRYVRIAAGHELHMGNTARYLEALNGFVDEIEKYGEDRLPDSQDRNQ